MPWTKQITRLALIFMSVWLPACTVSDALTRTPPPTIKLAQRDWLGFQLNTAVAQILLEEQLGYPVELVETTTPDQVRALAEGEIHADLEIWPTAWQEGLANYPEIEGKIEFGDPLGVVGKIGWYIPAYTLADHPEIASWRGLRQPDSAALFATPSTAPRGQFLSGAPEWFDLAPDLIKNLNLPLQQVFAGSESALIAAIETAYESRQPLLFYFWSPHYLFTRYDLIEIELPPYSDACYSQQSSGGVACDYPTDVLFKAYSTDLPAMAPDAYYFLKHFQYPTEEQISMMAMVELQGVSVEEAARAWINQHQEIWRLWLPPGRSPKPVP